MSEREPLGAESPLETPATEAPEPAVEASEVTASEFTASEVTESHAPEGGLDPDVEVVDGFPVLAEVRAVERVSPASLPAVQAAAAAGAGFVAGAATMALVRRRAARKRAVRNGRGGRRPADLLPIAATRSFLVDVHVIAKGE
jgi:hypothetical protein